MIYNFVQNTANTAGLGSVSWYAIGSTQTVDARTNTLTRASDVDAPMFLLDGITRIANNNADLWDGTILNAINLSENEDTIMTQIFTGTKYNGSVVTDPADRWLVS